MREFQNGNSFHNNEGKLLVGRVTFYKKGTSVKESIYNNDGAVIANPIYTNQIGQTAQQVFLGDTDYTISFEQYIGNGNMETDTDERHWLFQYSVDNLYKTIKVDVDSKGLQVINTIEDLRKTNPTAVEESNGNRIVLLAGYNTAGDKPSVQYVWNSDSIDSDNGGDVIKVNDITVGRWCLINDFDNGLDVRHFGVFPAASAIQTTVGQNYQIQSANQYAAKLGVTLVFPSSNETALSYYRVNNQTISNVVPNGHCRFVTIDGATIYLADNVEYIDIDKDDGFAGVINVYGKNIQSSVLKDNVTVHPSSKLVVVGNLISNYSMEYSDIIIDMRTDFEWLSYGNNPLELDNCVIEGAGGFDDPMHGLILKNMTVKEEWFGPNFDWDNLTVENCIIDIHNFHNVKYYIAAKNQQNDSNYGDLRGYTFDEEDKILGNFYIKNANGVIHSNIINVNGTFENCNIETYAQFGNLELKDSSIKTNSRSISSLKASNSTIDTGGAGGLNWDLSFCTVLSPNLYVMNLIGRFCRFNQTLTCMSDSELYDCVIPNDLVLGYATTASNKATIQRNTIGGNVHYTVYNNMEAIFTDNVINGQIKWDLIESRMTGRAKVVNFVAIRNKTVGPLIDWTNTSTWFIDDDRAHNYFIDEELSYDFQLACNQKIATTFDYTGNDLEYMTFDDFTTDISIMTGANVLVPVNAFGTTHIKPIKINMSWDETEIPGATFDAYIHKDPNSTQPEKWTYFWSTTAKYGKNPNSKQWITQSDNRIVAIPKYNSVPEYKNINDLTYAAVANGKKLFRFCPFIAEKNTRHIIPSSTATYQVDQYVVVNGQKPADTIHFHVTTTESYH